jgi:hypothetical protein
MREWRVQSGRGGGHGRGLEKEKGVGGGGGYLVANQQVLRLDVTVDDVLGVAVPKCTGDGVDILATPDTASVSTCTTSVQLHSTGSRVGGHAID